MFSTYCSTAKLQLMSSSSTAQHCSSILPRRLLRLLPRSYRRRRILPQLLLPLFTAITITTTIISLFSVYIYWTTNQFTFSPNPPIVYTAAQMHSVQKLKLSPSSDPCGAEFPSPLLVVVTSAPNHFAQRSAIRETWGGRAAELGIRLLYLIGEIEDNLPVQENLYREHFTHGDLLQAFFADTYFNLTLKSLAMMNWIGRTLKKGHCSTVRYALKVDDDMFVNIEAIERLVKMQIGDNDGEKFIGRLHSKDRPIRRRFNRYYLPEESFSKTVFPDFFTGAAYLFTARSAAALYHTATQEPEQAIFLEDVYVTGILPEKLGNRIRREDHPNFINWKISVDNRADFDRIWTSHNVSPKEMRKRWQVVNQRSQLTCGLYWWGCT